MTYPIYDCYKDSEIPWLGQVPERWDLINIKWMTPVKRGASPRPIENPIYFDEDGEYAWVRISDVSASSEYLYETEQRLSELGSSLSVKMQPHQLFLSIAGSVGKPIITKIKCCIHDGFVYFPELKDNPKFLFYIFLSGQPYLGLGKMGTQLNLNTDTVGSIKIGLPSLSEQEAIVALLDRKTGEIGALIEKNQALLKLLVEQRIALITHAVTKGLNPDAPMKDSGIDWLGQVPERWALINIKWMTPVKRGASPRPIENPIYFDDEGEYAWVRISDVSASNEYLYKTVQKLSEIGSSLSVKMQPLQLFLSIAGSVGKPIITKIKCCIHDGFVYFPALKDNPKFLFYIFLSGQPYLGLGKMGTQLNLNTDTVGSIKVGLPPLSEQKAIVAFLDQKTTEMDQTVNLIKQAIEKLKEYRIALITNAVTGKIKVV